MSKALAVDAGRIKPPRSDISDAASFVRVLEAMPARSRRTSTKLIGPGGLEVPVPASLFDVLLLAARETARGNAIELISVHTELTTQRAADLLAVSRPHLIKLIDSGGLPHHLVGKHRRIRFEDLMAYKERRDQDRTAALERLTRSAEDLGLEY